MSKKNNYKLTTSQTISALAALTQMSQILSESHDEEQISLIPPLLEAVQALISQLPRDAKEHIMDMTDPILKEIEDNVDDFIEGNTDSKSNRRKKSSKTAKHDIRSAMVDSTEEALEIGFRQAVKNFRDKHIELDDGDNFELEIKLIKADDTIATSKVAAHACVKTGKKRHGRK